MYPCSLSRYLWLATVTSTMLRSTTRPSRAVGKVSVVNSKGTLLGRKRKGVQGRTAAWMVATFCRRGRLPLRVYTENLIYVNVTGRSYGGHRE